MEKLQTLASTLKKKGFRVTYCNTLNESRQALLSDIKDGETVGIGGSMTIKELDILESLADKGCAVHWHWLNTANGNETRRLAANADVYLCSTNAITDNGELVNIDGTGNRVASMFFGPGRNIVVIGKNKVASDYEVALKRIKEVACPKNAVRLNLNTPCATTGKCNDCASSSRMCNVTTVISDPPGGRDIHIILVNEDMGY